jgi:hypothetical protein
MATGGGGFAHWCRVLQAVWLLLRRTVSRRWVMVDTPTLKDPLAALESAFVDEYLRSRGYSREALEQMPKRTAERLLAEAEEEASLLLAQIDARSQYLKRLESRRSK